MNLVVAGYKINIQKSVEFLYNNTEAAEREIKTFYIYTGTQNNRIPRNKINERDEKPVLWKL